MTSWPRKQSCGCAALPHARSYQNKMQYLSSNSFLFVLGLGKKKLIQAAVCSVFFLCSMVLIRYAGPSCPLKPHRL